jgi:hypothetical protein
MAIREPCVYILALENDKWFVGYTKYPYKTISDHFAGNIDGWTKIYKPKEIFLKLDFNICQLNTITLDLMQIQGVGNVRGGCWDKVQLKNVSNLEGRKLDILNPFIFKN